MISRVGSDVRWWIWAGYRANATLSDLTDGTQRFTDANIGMRGNLTIEMWKEATADAVERSGYACRTSMTARWQA